MITKLGAPPPLAAGPPAGLARPAFGAPGSARKRRASDSLCAGSFAVPPRSLAWARVSWYKPPRPSPVPKQTQWGGSPPDPPLPVVVLKCTAQSSEHFMPTSQNVYEKRTPCRAREGSRKVQARRAGPARAGIGAARAAQLGSLLFGHPARTGIQKTRPVE
jgi:hypothetical protein